ncbi:hypothetical protein [Mycobacterium sp.]|nr:hypothetical protein [Mycobacterium sp.]
MRINWMLRLAQAGAALFPEPTRDADDRHSSGELDRITVRFREHG